MVTLQRTILFFNFGNLNEKKIDYKVTPFLAFYHYLMDKRQQIKILEFLSKVITTRLRGGTETTPPKKEEISHFYHPVSVYIYHLAFLLQTDKTA